MKGGLQERRDDGPDRVLSLDIVGAMVPDRPQYRLVG